MKQLNLILIAQKCVEGLKLLMSGGILTMLPIRIVKENKQIKSGRFVVGWLANRTSNLPAIGLITLASLFRGVQNTTYSVIYLAV